MKLRFSILSISVIVAVISGCRLETTAPPSDRVTVTGTDVAINEIFTISPDKHYSFSWIELYNPTDHDIKFRTQYIAGGDSTGDTVVASFLTLRMNVQRRFFDFRNLDYITKIDTGEAILSAFLLSGDSTIFAGTFNIITNNFDFFDAHFRSPPFDPKVFDVRTLFIADSTVEVGVRPFYWYPLTSNEVVLERTTVRFFVPATNPNAALLLSLEVKVVDRVRFGGYSSPPPDPSPSNLSLGTVPENMSVARYSNYFKTGNTSDEFYISPDPIPGWYSQRYHP